VNPYVVSLAAGALAGVLYGIIGVRSPSPPAIALVGLLGLLLGEQIVPIAQRVISGQPLTMEWVKRERLPLITGASPPAAAEAIAQNEATTTSNESKVP
jgi:XapX domain-containing protein